jgi:hypothetical protein
MRRLPTDLLLLVIAFSPGLACHVPTPCWKVGGIRCEGNTLVTCTGGWGTGSLFAQQRPCGADARCGSFTEDFGHHEPSCLQVRGTCDPGSFVPTCIEVSRAVARCVAGEVLLDTACAPLPDGGWLEGAVGGPIARP